LLEGRSVSVFLDSIFIRALARAGGTLGCYDMVWDVAVRLEIMMLTTIWMGYFAHKVHLICCIRAPCSALRHPPPSLSPAPSPNLRNPVKKPALTFLVIIKKRKGVARALVINYYENHTSNTPCFSWKPFLMEEVPQYPFRANDKVPPKIMP